MLANTIDISSNPSLGIVELYRRHLRNSTDFFNPLGNLYYVLLCCAAFF